MGGTASSPRDEMGAGASEATKSASSGSFSKRFHVVLMGDSTIDNKGYVGDDPSLTEILTTRLQKLNPQNRVTRLAMDGAMCGNLTEQVKRLPKDATHIIISAGGNNALGHSSMVHYPCAKVGDALMRLYAPQQEFEKQYTQVIEKVLSRNVPTAVCTVYNMRAETEAKRRHEQTAGIIGLCAFNDVITRTACRFGLPVIDLRMFFTEYTDYANPIEPSSQGSAKMADRIVQVVTTHDFSKRQCVLYK